VKDGEQNSTVTSLNADHQREIQEKRENIKTLLLLTGLLGRQAIAFRGHDESDTSENRGNFREILSVECQLEKNPIDEARKKVRILHKSRMPK
jgi:hypothetical protein